jgi:hypothetical protein
VRVEHADGAQPDRDPHPDLDHRAGSHGAAVHGGAVGSCDPARDGARLRVTDDGAAGPGQRGQVRR